MRLFAAAMTVIPLMATPVYAANNDFMGQAQRFLNQGNDDQERAYERGRQDEEMRNRQANRDRQYDNRSYRDDNRGYRDDNRGYRDDVRRDPYREMR